MIGVNNQPNIDQKLRQAQQRQGQVPQRPGMNQTKVSPHGLPQSGISSTMGTNPSINMTGPAQSQQMQMNAQQKSQMLKMQAPRPGNQRKSRFLC